MYEFFGGRFLHIRDAIMVADPTTNNHPYEPGALQFSNPIQSNPQSVKARVAITIILRHKFIAFLLENSRKNLRLVSK